MNKRKKKKYPEITFTFGPEDRLARLGQEDAKVDLSEKWLDITAEVENWVGSRVNPRPLETPPSGNYFKIRDPLY